MRRSHTRCENERGDSYTIRMSRLARFDSGALRRF